jgi:hypothetical protein
MRENRLDSWRRLSLLRCSLGCGGDRRQRGIADDGENIGEAVGEVHVCTPWEDLGPKITIGERRPAL